MILAEDIVELDYSGQATLASMGRIGNGGGQGYECHNSLAIDAASGELLGLACEILHRRADKPAGEGVAASRERDSRESLLWVNAVQRIGPAPAGGHWVNVCDRGADTFEFLEYECRNDRHFVVRPRTAGRYRGTWKASPICCTTCCGPWKQLGWEVDLSANRGQPSRRVRLLCSWTAVTLLAPHVHRGRHSRLPLAVWYLRSGRWMHRRKSRSLWSGCC